MCMRVCIILYFFLKILFKSLLMSLSTLDIWYDILNLTQYSCNFALALVQYRKK